MLRGFGQRSSLTVYAKQRRTGDEGIHERNRDDVLYSVLCLDRSANVWAEGRGEGEEEGLEIRSVVIVMQDDGGQSEVFLRLATEKGHTGA